MLDYNILMLVHPSSGEHTFYKVKDANHIVLIDSFGNEPPKGKLPILGYPLLDGRQSAPV